MSGPTSIVTAASSVESTHTPFDTHFRSPPRPRPTQPIAAPNHRPDHANQSFSPSSAQGQPDLPTLDVPSFDFDDALKFDFDLDLSFAAQADRPSTAPGSDEPTPPVRNDQKMEAPPAPRPTDKMGGRKKSLLARPQSWVSHTKSSPSVPQVRVAGSKEGEKEEKGGKESKQGEDKAKQTDDKGKQNEDKDKQKKKENEDVDDKQKKKQGEDKPKNKPREHEPASPGLLDPNAPTRTRKATDTFASFARRSWISTSRSPSPSPSDKEAPDYLSHDKTNRSRSPSNASTTSNTSTGSSTGKLGKFSRKRPVSNVEGDPPRPDSLTRFGSYLSKIQQRPSTAAAKGAAANDGTSTSSSVSSLAPPSTSNRLSNATAASEASTVSVSNDASLPQVRDALWSAFKALEAEYQKFQGKTVAVKVSLIRASLIPFLKNYASHPSNKRLHYEDLERRASILDKWWTGLLEMLDGKAHQPVAGVDRPTVIEATTILMMRPEWRQGARCFTPLVDRDQERAKRKAHARPAEDSSNESMSSTDSDYVAESAEHNVRNMFAGNLVTQTAIVVDKLSQRHAPLSLVNFAGKTCAYAFFFAPGVADALVRLWALTPELMRRVAEELGLPRRSKEDSSGVVAPFPPNAAGLGWTCVKAMTSALRQNASLPLATAKIAWRGAWVSRWRGQDTDLFFIFCKYYYILAEEFMPAGLPLVDKARAPGFVLVNAQMLSALDATVHRQAAVDAAMFGPASTEGDHGMDASATALPVAPNNNSMKGMNENRLIALLKDFLSAGSIGFAEARHTFAQSFMALMKASAKRTSQFDHNACFTLCDFLEESLVTYDSFVNVHRPTFDYVDWPFWFAVCGKILESNNTMSEIRVLSLIFAIWDAVANEPSRKAALCLDWLLTEESFDKLFNNWCPMIRAYYTRLLCWRICRETGSATETDLQIYDTVSTRLKTVWSNYLWLKQTADAQGKLAPSTAPCYPTPGKRFMIMRHEVPAAQGMMMGFDSFSTAFTMPETTAVAAPSAPEPAEPASPDATTYKKKWNIFGKVLSFAGGTNGGSDLESVRRETAAARKPPTTPPKPAADTVTPPPSDTDSMGSSPVYEALQYIFRFTLSWNAPNLPSPPNRVLTRPRLPAPAQARVGIKRTSESTPPVGGGGRPAPTRAVSGSQDMGLMQSVRNANSSEAQPELQRLSTNLDQRFSSDDGFDAHSPIDLGNVDQFLNSVVAPTPENIVQPAQPAGPFVRGAKYAGRALAEWGLVVCECNSFVERRRDEGVASLGQVEVPTLGVEGFRKMG